MLSLFYLVINESIYKLYFFSELSIRMFNSFNVFYTCAHSSFSL
jgi:hypothetical protein